ncbi:MAG: diguanylate cyclase [Prochloraceae cyanobacterium]|nr:diguanylate cyclase [Prochloraceae cyanobacterium]
MNKNSMIMELRCYDEKVELSTSATKLTEMFAADPGLPGVLLSDKDRIIGAISRESFQEYMSRPYSLELAAKRKIEYLLKYVYISDLFVFSNTLIVEAATQALARETSRFREPLIIMLTPIKCKLVSITELLGAYAKISQINHQLLEETNLQLTEANENLELASGKDKTTGLGNDALFKSYLLKKWSKSLLKRDWLSVILLEINLLQKDLGRYDRLALNGCLRKVSSILLESLDELTDTAFYLDRNKFAIIMENSNTIKAGNLSKNISEKIRQIELENFETKAKKNLSLNLGVACIKPNQGDNPDNLLNSAEECLHQSKIIGENLTIVDDISSRDSQRLVNKTYIEKALL